jgi:hypothetical protein
MKAVMWLVVKQNVTFQVEGFIGFMHNLPRSFKCCNPYFFSELEEDVKKVRGRLMKTGFVILGDWNARISDLQINLPHTHIWDSVYMMDGRGNISY